MPNHPDVRNEDHAAFERCLDVFFPTASRTEILLAVGDATRFIKDNWAMPAHIADRVFMANAVSTLRRSVNVLNNRLATASRRIEELEAPPDTSADSDM